MKNWKDVTKEDLFELAFRQNLPDCVIADMYGVKKSSVAYKRAVKFGLKRGIDSYAFRRYCKELMLKELEGSKGMFAGYDKKTKKEALEFIKSMFSDITEV